MTRLAALVAAAFAAGIALGLAAGSWGGHRGPAASPRAPEEAPRTSMPVETAEAPAHREPDRTGEVEPVGRARELISRAIEALPVPAAPAGEGSIAGSVTTETGEPIAGVTVRAEPARRRERPNRPPAESGPPASDAPGDVLDFARDRAWERAHRTEAVTDAAGAFSIDGLAAGDYAVAAYLRGFRFQAGAMSEATVPVPPSAKVQFIGKAVCGIRASVVLPDGGRAETAQIELQPAGGRALDRFPASWSARDPVLWVAPGSWKLRAARGEELASDWTDVETAAGAAEVEVSLPLQPRLGIRGRVVLPDGERIDDILVSLRGGSADPGRRRAAEGMKKTWAGARGSFSFGDLAAGVYRLEASLADGRLLASEVVELEDSWVTRDLEPPPPRTADFVVLRVFGPAGEALTDVRIDTGAAGARGGFTGRAAVVRLADGSFRVFHPSREELGDDAATCWVQVTAEAYGTQRVEYVPAETQQLRIDFPPPATLELTLANYSGSGYEGALRLELRGDGDGLPPRAVTDRLTVLGPLRPGSYRLALHYSRYQPFLIEPLALAAGLNQAAVPLPPLHSLTVVLDDLQGTEEVHLVLEKGKVSGQGLEPRENGKVVFEKVPAGQYWIAVTGRMALEEMEVTVPASGEVRFRPRPVICLSVTVKDQSGYLASRGLRSGDLIVAIDGATFESPAHLVAALLSAGLRREIKLGLVRNGQELEVPVNPRLLRSVETMGGALWPASH